MAEYKLVSAYVTWNGTEMPQVTHIGMGQEGGGVDRKETTHANDTTKQYLDGLPDSIRDTATLKARDVSGTTGFYNLLRGSTPISGTLIINPRGTTASTEKFTGVGWITTVGKPEALYEDVVGVDVQFVCSMETSSGRFTLGSN